MKRTSLSLILVFSLLGTPAPAQVSNGMGDMMSIMMEMFLWMMSGGSGGFNRYNNIGSLGGIGNPMLAGSMLGNPLLGNSLMSGVPLGYPSGLGGGLPYYNQGMYSPLAYPGLSPYSSPYSGSPYYRDSYGRSYYENQPFYRQGYNNPYYPDYYSRNSPYAGPYRSGPYRHPGEYNRYGSRSRSSEQDSPVVIQPIIVRPGQQDSIGEAGGAEANLSVEALPPVSATTAVEPDPYDYAYRDPARNADPAWNSDSPLYGRWQGVNGEYMELGSDRFRMRSNGAELEGTYQLKNSILKAVIPDREEPVYMQYMLDDGHLMFLSEDGQKMLFRRLP